VQNMDVKIKRILFVGIDTMFWPIWLIRNDIVFNKKPILSYMLGWPSGQERGRRSKRKKVKWLSELHAINGDHVTMEIFVKHGWWSNNKLSCSWTSVACYHLVMLGLLAHVN
jgi:hypothetical protein